jgi:hypothetical protein
MNQEEKSAKRALMRQRKLTALTKIYDVAKMLSDANIEDYIVTGSAALIIHGFMFHRDAADVDIRICIPRDDSDYSKRVLDTLKNWEILFPEEKTRTKDAYGNATSDKYFTIVYHGTKVNFFAMSEEDYEEIPFNNVHGIMMEDVASVVFDKMSLDRGKDYKDLQDCKISWLV